MSTQEEGVSVTPWVKVGVALTELWDERIVPFLESLPILPQEILNQWKLNPTNLDHMTHMAVVAVVMSVAVSIVLWKCCQRVGTTRPLSSVKNFVVPGKGPRFRKRDRIEFMSRKAARSAKAVGTYIRGGQGRKRRDMAKLVKRIGNFMKTSPDREDQMLKPELPQGYLEEDGGHDSDTGGHVPESVELLFKHLRIFGDFESPVKMELMRSIERVNLSAGDYLFKIGEHDENMFIVESGILEVCYDYNVGPDTTPIQLKTVRAGEPIVSLLSFLDYMAGQRKVFKTVSAKAKVDTKVYKVSFACFKSAFDAYPQSLSQVVHVVMVRLQRVTLLALHQYLGLGAELINQQHRGLHNVPKRHSSQPEGELADIDGPAAGAISVPSGSSRAPAISPVDGPEDGTTAGLAMSVFRNKKKLATYSDEQLRQLAVDTIKKQLGITEEDLIDNNDSDLLEDIELVGYAEGQVIVEEDSVNHDGLFLVLKGCVGVSQQSFDKEAKDLHKAYPGGLLGQLQVLTQEPSFFSYTAKVPSRVAVITGFNVRKLMERHPYIAVNLAMSVVSNLSPDVRSIDFALEWMLLESGKALYKQNAEAESTYVVLSGRLRSVITRQGGSKREMVAEFGRGELCGIVETLMKTRRSTTVLAVRDTEVAKLPAGLIDFIKMKFPTVLMRLIKLLGEKLQQSWEKGNDSRAPMSGQLQHSPQIAAQANFSTVAIIAQSPHIHASAFTLELLHALQQIDPALRLTKEFIRNELGPSAFDKASDIRLNSWLNHQEDKHRVVLYQCDNEVNSWTKLCIRHADVILILVDPTSPTKITPLEENLENYSKRTRKEMIFLHKEDVKYPKGTSEWYRERGWINAHYHVKCQARMNFKKTMAKVEQMYARILANGPAPDIHSDFSRLARMITGTSVGLVLGGGGARGCSHVGMIKAILEAGIPIDRVAGVSIGALIGGIWCQEKDVTNMIVKARSFCGQMTNIWRQILDLTYPYTAYFSGQGFNAVISSVFNERDILDLWIPFFTITTDITESAMRIHDYGKTIIIIQSRLFSIYQTFLIYFIGSLWRYVRSSMSLAGYLPPLCDPHDGHLLLDGGYVNNLPADVMRMRGAHHILAIDVGSQDEKKFTNYGDSLSGLKVLWSRWNPFVSPIIVPNQADVQSRLAYVSCVGKLEGVKNAEYCNYIRPPIDRYGTLQFSLFEEIKNVGYYHGKTYFLGLKKAGLMRQFLSQHSNSGFFDRPTHFNLSNAIRRGSMENLSSSLESQAGVQSSSMPNDFGGGLTTPKTNLTDLAEMVCTVQQPFKSSSQEIHGEKTRLGASRYGARGDSDDEYDDDTDLTSENSENLLSNEEDDNGESGFFGSKSTF